VQRDRRRELAGAVGVLAGTVLLVAGCSSPEPAGPATAPAPLPSASAPATTPSSSPTSASPSAAASSAPASSAAPSPSTGGDESVEPSRPVQTAAPKKLDEPTKTAGARVSLVSVKATTIKASGPGDSSGPGVLIRLKVVNTTGKKLDTSFVQVNVGNEAGDPGTLVTGSPTDPLTGSLRPGASAQATYAFLLSDARSGPVTVSVYVTSGQPVVQFRGRAS
jgi:hypothetical protein